MKPPKAQLVPLPYSDTPQDVKPYSPETERAVLGAVLLAPACVELVIESADEESFYLDAHRLIFQGMKDCFEAHGSTDPVLLGNALSARGTLKACGGVEYIARLSHSTPAAANLPAHLSVLREKARMRKIIDISARAAQRAREPGGSSKEVLSEAEDRLLALSASTQTQAYKNVGEIAQECLQDLEKLGAGARGPSTGFPCLDELVCGIHPGLYVFAGRPKMGKTAFGMSLALNLARQKVPTVVFSLEMSRKQLTQRVLCSLARLEPVKFRRGDLAREDWQALVAAMNQLSSIPLYIEEAFDLSPMSFRARTRRMKRELGIEAALVDYLQLMQAPSKDGNRVQEVSQITRGLKLVSAELDMPVIALSQLSRAVEKRPSKRPMLSDLRDSGSIEQDADLIGFLYREEYYLREAKKSVPLEMAGRCELSISAQRSGPTGTCNLYFNERIATFENQP